MPTSAGRLNLSTSICLANLQTHLVIRRIGLLFSNKVINELYKSTLGLHRCKPKAFITNQKPKTYEKTNLTLCMNPKYAAASCLQWQRYDLFRLAPKIFAVSSPTCCDGGWRLRQREETASLRVAKGVVKDVIRRIFLIPNK